MLFYFCHYVISEWEVGFVCPSMDIVLVKRFLKATSYLFFIMRVGDKYFGFTHCFILRWSNYILNCASCGLTESVIRTHFHYHAFKHLHADAGRVLWVDNEIGKGGASRPRW